MRQRPADDLRRRWERGDRRALDFCADDETLEALTGWVCDRARRQDRARLFLVAVGVGLVAAGALALANVDAGSFALAPLAAAFVIALVGLRPGPLHRDAVRRLRDTLPRASVAQVPRLLALSHALGHTPASPRNPTYALLLELHTALLDRLPRWERPDPVAPEQRRALRRLVLWYERSRPELAAVALTCLAEAGDRSLRRRARRWSERYADERFRDAVVEYLRATEKAP